VIQDVVVLLLVTNNLLVLHYRNKAPLPETRLVILGALVINGVPDSLVLEDLLYLINVRIVLIKDLYLAGVRKLSITANGRV
jgi:hypothetical protein